MSGQAPHLNVSRRQRKAALPQGTSEEQREIPHYAPARGAQNDGFAGSDSVK